MPIRLTDDEFRVLAEQGKPEDLDRLNEEELQHFGRLLNQGDRTGVGAVSVQAQANLNKISQQPPIDTSFASALGDQAKQYGRSVVGAVKEIPNLGPAIFSGRAAEDFLPEPDYQAEANQVTQERTQPQPKQSIGQSLLATGDKVAEAAFWAERALLFGSDENRIASEVIVNMASGMARDFVNLASDPGKQLKEHPGLALSTVADIAGVGAGLKVARAGRMAKEIKAASVLDEAAAVAEQSPEVAVAVARKADETSDVLDEAAAIVRTQDPVKAETTKAVAEKLREVSERAAARAGKTVQEELDSVRAAKVTPESVAEDVAIDAAQRTGEEGFIKSVVAAKLGSGLAGAAVGGAAPNLWDDEAGFSIPGAIIGGVAGVGGVKYLTEPKFREAVNNAMSIKARHKDDFEALAVQIIAPLLPDRYVSGSSLAAASTLGGAAFGGLSAYGATDSPVAGLMGAAIGGALGKRLGSGAAMSEAGWNPRRTYMRLFTEEAGLPAEVAARRKVMRNNMAGRVNEIADVSRKLAALPQESQNLIDRFRRGQIGLAALPEDIRDIAVRSGEIFDELALDIVDVGLAEGDLANTILSNVGTYLPRLYLEHEKADVLGTVARYLRGRGEPMSRLSDLSYLKKRQDLPEDVRRALGELSSEFDNAAPGYLLARRGTVTAADIEYARYSNWLASSPDYTLQQAFVDNPAQHGLASFNGPGNVQHITYNGQNYRKLGDSKRLGALRNRYVQEDIAYDLETSLSTASGLNKFMEKSTALFKGAKVTYNPASLLRNIYGGLIMTDAGAGLSPARIDIYGKALRDYAKQTPRYLEARAGGLFGGTFFGSEIRSLLTQADRADNFAEAVLKTGYDKIDKPLAAMERFHESTEHAFKMAVYNYARDVRGLGVEDAVEYAKRYTFDYREVPQWIKVYRKSLFGAPFISFSYKAMPRVLGSAIAVGDPKRFFNFWKYPLAFGAVNEYSARKLGFKDGNGIIGAMKDVVANGLGFGNSDKMKKLLPDYVGDNQILLPWRDQFGRLQYYDLTWTLPWGDIGEVGKGQVGKALIKAGIPFPRQLEPSNPWLQMMAAALSGGKDPFTGREIVPPLSSQPEAASAIGSWLGRLWLPSLAPTGFGYDKLSKSFSGEYADRPDVPSPAMALLSEVGGVKIRPMDPATEYARKRRDLERRISEGKTEIRRLRFAGKPSEEVNAKVKRIQKMQQEFAAKYGQITEYPPTPPAMQEALRQSRGN